MKELNVREMRAAIGQLEQIVQASGEITILRRGKPIARANHRDTHFVADSAGTPTSPLSQPAFRAGPTILLPRPHPAGHPVPATCLLAFLAQRL